MVATTKAEAVAEDADDWAERAAVLFSRRQLPRRQLLLALSNATYALWQQATQHDCNATGRDEI